jgi:methionyl-tRNA synthetase
MDRLDLQGGAAAAWSLVTTANQYIVQTAPWALAKAGREEELDAVLASLARCLYRLAIMATPFLPTKAGELWQALGLATPQTTGTWASTGAPPVAGCRTTRPPVLFPKPSVEPAS